MPVMVFAHLLKDIVVTRFTFDNSKSIPLSTLLQRRYVIIPGNTPPRYRLKSQILIMIKLAKAYKNPTRSGNYELPKNPVT